MKISKTTLKEVILTYIIPVLLVTIPGLLYVCYRAYYLSFTHDESLSFFMANGDQEFVMTPNNHLLNTALMKISGTLFGNSEFSLRLPNVLAFVLFCISGIAIIKNIKRPGLSVFFLAILVFNPNMFEFFGVARGYGLSMGLMMASFYWLFKLDNQALPIKKYLVYLVLSLFFSQLALYANLNAVNVHLALLVVLFIGLIIYLRANPGIIKMKVWKTAFIAVFILDIIALMPAIIRLRMLQQINELAVFGNHQGLIKTTLQSLIASFYYHEQDYPITFKIIFIFVLGITALSGLWFLYRSSKKNFNNFSRIFLLYFLLLVAPVLQEVIFNIPYPSSRTAILYFPIFSLLFIFFISDTANATKKTFLKVCLVTLTIGVSTLITAHTINKRNFTYNGEWYYEAHNKEILEMIAEDRATHGGPDTVTISNFWAFAPSINYYRVTKPYPWLQPAVRENYLKGDYYICFFDNMPKLSADSVEFMKKYEDARVAVYRRFLPFRKSK